MGWFESKDGHTLGDTPLDELRACLRVIGESYRQALNRPPTMDEIIATLVTVLNGFDDEAIAGMSSLEVTDIKIKTKKRSKKGQWAAGDVFAAKLPDGSYTFGRVLFNDMIRGNTLVELFKCRSTRPRLPGPLASMKRLMPPMSVSGIKLFEERRWVILSHEPGFRAPDFDQIRLYTGIEGKWQIFDAEFKTIERAAKEIPPGATDKNRFVFDRPEILEAFILNQLTAAGVDPDSP